MVKSSKQKSSPSPEETGDTLAFWDQQAKTYGPLGKATTPDPHYQKLEIECALRAISALQPTSILDVGCGNGFATKIIADTFPDAKITGVDFSQGMIDEANHHHHGSNIDYHVGDILSLSRTPGLRNRQYDVVLSTRTLINLANWEEQKVGILEMRKMLKPDGHMILIENVKDGLDNLNSLRVKFGLPPIEVRWHNVYLVQAEIAKFFNEIRSHLLDVEYVENIGNLYYVASRVIYAKMCADQGIKPDYNNPINQIASLLPTMGEYYACSPNFMFVMRNVDQWPQDKKMSS